MAIKIKKKVDIKKEIQQPDEFITKSDRAVKFVSAHRQQFILGVAGTITLACIIWAIVAYTISAAEDASAALSDALVIMDTPIVEEPVEGEEKPPAPEGKTYKGRNEKYEASLAASNLVLENFGGSDVTDEAILMKGTSLHHLGKYDEAIKEYETYLEKNPKSSILPFVYQALAGTYTENGNPAKASEYLSKLSEIDPMRYGAYASYESGRIFEISKENEKAIIHYKNCFEVYPNSPQANQSRLKLEQMGVKLASAEKQE